MTRDDPAKKLDCPAKYTASMPHLENKLVDTKKSKSFENTLMILDATILRHCPSKQDALRH